MFQVTDDRSQPTRLTRPARRIVSLVPSDTYTLLRLGAAARVVGRTRYCVEPAALVEHIPIVGGTKDPDVQAILELQPDLVVLNREENTVRHYDKLQEAGVATLATCPTTMRDGALQVARLARVLGDSDDASRALVRGAYAALPELGPDPSARRVRAFVPIWTNPLMTIHGDTFLSDALACAGGVNVFADRTRRFPLAADEGRGPELPAERTAGRDTRYPRITLEEVAERRPELILLPDEPYAFGEDDAAIFRALDLPPELRIRFCSGKLLMWPGLMSLEGRAVLRALVSGADTQGTGHVASGPSRK